MTTCACLWDSTRQPIAPEGRSLSGTCNQTKTFNKKGASPCWRFLHSPQSGIRSPTQRDYRAPTPVRFDGSIATGDHRPLTLQ